MGHPTHSATIDGILGKLAEAGKDWKLLPKPALPNLISARSREEGNISHCPFLPKFRPAGKTTSKPEPPPQKNQKKTFVRIRSLNYDSWICFRYPYAVDPFSPRDNYCLFVHPILCPENLA